MPQTEIPGGFKRPFWLDTSEAFIWDTNGEPCCDFPDESGPVRARGWGRISSRNTAEKAEQIMDAWESWVLERAEGIKDKDEVVRRLNEEMNNHSF